MSNGAPRLDIDELIGHLRAGSAPGGPANVDTRPPGTDGGHAVIDYTLTVPQYSATELLALPETEFVRGCYLAFLGREAGPGEISRQRDRLLTWQASRLRIVRELRDSQAGRQYNGKVDGLWKVLAWDRLYWSPPAKAARAAARAVSFIWNLRRRLEKIEAASAHASALVARLQNELTRNRHLHTRQAEQFQERISAISQLADHIRETLAKRIENAERIHATHAAQANSRTGKLENDTTQLNRKAIDHWRAIVEQKLRLESLSATGINSAESAPSPGSSATNAPQLLDALYLSFEDRYRGSREDVKTRQKVYLPYVDACVSRLGRGVLDIGCGRGEWLELLGEAGIHATGLDLNRVAIEECRSRGLDVQYADGIEILRQTAGSTLTVITAFHVIEHLAFEDLIRLLDEALRTLRPGGLLIVETPNPGNLLVAAERFYLDPTHRNPLPSELVSYLVKARGFARAEVAALHPVESPVDARSDDPLLSLLHDKFFGAQDYGVIGWKSE